MLDINSTQICSYSPEQALSWSHSFTGVPLAIIIFIAAFLSFLLWGLILSKNKSKLLIIWLCAFVTSGIVLVFFIYSPNSIQSIVELFNRLFR